MSLKNLLWVGVIFTSCYAEYNPEGFTCVVDSFNIPNFPICTVKMTNPPLCMYQWDGTKEEFTDTKVYLKSFEFSFDRDEDNTDSIKYTIESDHIYSNVAVNKIRLRCLRYDNDPKEVFRPDPYTMTISIADLFSSSVYADFSTGFGRVSFGWYVGLELIVEIVNSLSEAKYGPKIFIDEYLLQ